MKLKVSVVIPMYNAEDTIKSCIDSVFNQTFKDDIEIIIVNDGSTDNSEDVVKSLVDGSENKRTIKVISQINGGVSKARNVGINNATGDFIALLDSDDEWLPMKLERQAQIIKENPTIEFLGCSRNNEVLKIFWKKINTLHRASIKELLIKMYPQTSTALFRRDLFEKLGGYNENMTHGEDGELWIRYCSASNFYYLPESLVITGNGKPSFGHSGLSANLKAMQVGNEYIIKEARKKGLISFSFFVFIYLYSKLKYLRRIIITKLR